MPEINTNYFRVSTIKRGQTDLDMETAKEIDEVINDMVRRAAKADAAIKKAREEKRMENMKKITYLELLEMVKAGKQPNMIKTYYMAEPIEYTWDNGNYMSGAKSLLSDKTFDWLSPFGHTTEQFIYYRENILDDAEKRYLKGVVRPFRDKVKYIEKAEIRTSKREYIRIVFNDGDVTAFPAFPNGEMYKNMASHVRYTLEELGL